MYAVMVAESLSCPGCSLTMALVQKRAKKPTGATSQRPQDPALATAEAERCLARKRELLALSLRSK
jgi:hypothetical protein